MERTLAHGVHSSATLILKNTDTHLDGEDVISLQNTYTHQDGEDVISNHFFPSDSLSNPIYTYRIVGGCRMVHRIVRRVPKLL